MFLKIEAALF